MEFDFGKDTLHVSGKWFNLYDIARMIGFRSPEKAITSFVSIENMWHEGFGLSEKLYGYGNEDGVWELIYAPTVHADTKRKLGAWFRDTVLEATDKKAEIMPFQHEQFGEIRVIEQEGEPWFVGKDIAEALGYSNPRKAIIDHVDEEDRGVTKCDTLGGKQEMTVINESGMYALILGSKLPTAKAFKRWVTSEVLPSIRKTGSYDVKQQEKAIQMIMQKFDRLEAKLVEDKPKVQFYDDMMASDGSIRIDTLANVLAKNGVVKENGTPIGRDSLFRELRERGFLTKGKALDGYGNKRYENRPTQRAIERGLFERVASHNHGILSYTVYVTPKGLAFFTSFFEK